jgi:hypothetical protein
MTKSKTAIAILTLCLTGLPAWTQSAAPAAAPDLKPAATPADLQARYPTLDEIEIPKVETYTLSNGMQLYLLPDDTLPIITGRALIRGEHEHGVERAADLERAPHLLGLELEVHLTPRQRGERGGVAERGATHGVGDACGGVADLARSREEVGGHVGNIRPSVSASPERGSGGLARSSRTR